MAKRGERRKRTVRKAGKNGSEARKNGSEERVNSRFAKWQRRWLSGLVPEERWLDPLCGDPLGLLLVINLIDEARYHGGLVFRDVARHYRRIHGLPSGSPKLLGVKGVSPGHYDPVLAETVTRRYLASRQAILRRGGRKAMRVVHHICCAERMIDRSELKALRTGLAALSVR